MNVMVYILAIVISIMTTLSLIVIIDQIINTFFKTNYKLKTLFSLPLLGFNLFF